MSTEQAAKLKQLIDEYVRAIYDQHSYSTWRHPERETQHRLERERLQTRAALLDYIDQQTDSPPKEKTT